MSSIDVTVLDLEMTGLNPRTDKIIEIGAVKVRGGNIIKTYSRMLSPGRKLSDTTVQITGITDEHLKDCPEFGDIREEFLDFIEEDVLLGHNIIFDYSFLKKAIINDMPKGIRFERDGIDTLKIARRFLPGEMKKQLTALCEFYQIELSAHRALNDAIATFSLHEKLWDLYYEKGQDIFRPKPLCYQVKKESPVMAKQIAQIQRLLAIYQIECPYELDKMTKNEASRYIDKIKTDYGAVSSKSSSESARKIAPLVSE